MEKVKEADSRIIMVTGGQRSGKSEWAEQMALSLSQSPAYVATARVWDEDFRQRVAAHQARRGPEWTNIEEPLDLSRIDLTGRVVLVDCVTLWATNLFFDCGEDVAESFSRLTGQFDAFISHHATYIFVTNEIGLGGVSENPMQRRFADLQGMANRYIASRADEVFMIISGLPLRLK